MRLRAIMSNYIDESPRKTFDGEHSLLFGRSTGELREFCVVNPYGYDLHKIDDFGKQREKMAPRGFEPLEANQKSPDNKELTKNSNPVFVTGLDKTLQKYSDLVELVKAWLELAEDTKKAIKALFRYTKSRRSEWVLSPDH